MKTLTAKDAKYRFGCLIDLARAEPVVIAKHGRPVVVVLAMDLPPLETRADASRVLSFLLAEAGGGEVTPGEAEKLARLVREHHKAVQLTEFEERLRGLEEQSGLVPGPG